MDNHVVKSSSVTLKFLRHFPSILSISVLALHTPWIFSAISKSPLLCQLQPQSDPFLQTQYLYFCFLKNISRLDELNKSNINSWHFFWERISAKQFIKITLHLATINVDFISITFLHSHADNTQTGISKEVTHNNLVSGQCHLEPPRWPSQLRISLLISTHVMI